MTLQVFYAIIKGLYCSFHIRRKLKMKPKFYSTQELDTLIHMLEHMLQEWKMFTGLKKPLLQNHPWLSPVIGPLSEVDQFIHTSNNGKVRTEFVATPSRGNLVAQVLHITLPAACISQNEEPLWGAFVPHQFYFTQISEGCYALSDKKTPYYEMAYRSDASAYT